MRPRPETRRRAAPGQLLRATLTERWVHRSFGLLMGVCIATAAILYIGPLSIAVGRRSTVEWVHVISGAALPLPILIGLASRAFRADLRRLNRFSPVDWEWLRSKNRRSGRLPVGKFNAGQKLNASFVTGATLVMLGTGLIMRFANAWPVRWRTGATFVHDWIAYAIGIVIIGHLFFATRDPEARQGMRTGAVPEAWARREHRGWAEEQVAAEAADDASPPG
ncbi:MAG: cytochrome b/b6 domain-containing protein [Mycobacteriales bacterium]|nr:MAG: formate dehydrogenase [Pseudonocardiales bacterium]